VNVQLTNNLKDWLCCPLVNYISVLKSQQGLNVAQDIEVLEQFARKCSMLDETFDYFNREQILNLFKNKQPHQIERYVKVLTGLIS
jgi:tellurite resistance protein